MHKPHFQKLLEAVAEDEALESCDRLTRGEVKSEEVEAQLSGASERVQALRSMSEPLSAELRKRLGDILERPAETVPLSPPIPLRARPRLPRYAVPLGASLALAAGIAMLVIPQQFRSESLPEFALETGVHDNQVLGTAATATAGVVHAKKDSCLELTLRPNTRYHGALSAQLFLIPPSGGTPLSWSSLPTQSAAGTLRSEGPCIRLPASVEPGEWQLVAAYGSQLPDANTLRDVLAHTPKDQPAHGKGWATRTQQLVISN